MQSYEEIADKLVQNYMNRYIRFAFRSGMQCDMDEKQYEALILKLQHGIEKGLSAFNYRPGAGKDYFLKLVFIMKQYEKKYDISADFYRTALSTLERYIKQNKSEGQHMEEMETMLKELLGEPNDCGGIMNFVAKEKKDYASANFKELIESRHSIRHFSPEPVLLEDLKKAIELANFTPSACNRQGWKSRIIVNKEIKTNILKNQNGNKGFGDEIDKIIVITFDLRYSNIERELFQAFIDGGMYAMSVLYALQYMGIASIPLSASLHSYQEENIRHLIGMDEAEVLILFIGVGNYADECKVTISKRKEDPIEVI